MFFNAVKCLLSAKSGAISGIKSETMSGEGGPPVRKASTFVNSKGTELSQARAGKRWQEGHHLQYGSKSHQWPSMFSRKSCVGDVMAPRSPFWSQKCVGTFTHGVETSSDDLPLPLPSGLYLCSPAVTEALELWPFAEFNACWESRHEWRKLTLSTC